MTIQTVRLVGKDVLVYIYIFTTASVMPIVIIKIFYRQRRKGEWKKRRRKIQLHEPRSEIILRTKMIYCSWSSWLRWLRRSDHAERECDDEKHKFKYCVYFCMQRDRKFRIHLHGTLLLQPPPWVKLRKNKTKNTRRILHTSLTSLPLLLVKDIYHFRFTQLLFILKKNLLKTHIRTCKYNNNNNISYTI